MSTGQCLQGFACPMAGKAGYDYDLRVFGLGAELLPAVWELPGAGGKVGGGVQPTT